MEKTAAPKTSVKANIDRYQLQYMDEVRADQMNMVMMKSDQFEEH